MEVAHCYLDGNADAVEFCPHESFHNVLAAATYTLREGEQPSRSGSISLFDVEANAGKLELFHRADTGGIFDIKWNPVGGNHGPMLAQADADGCVRLHTLKRSGEQDGIGAVLEEARFKKVSSSMCLCLDWDPVATSIAVGLSDGSISIIALQESQLNAEQEWKAHEFELWATSFDLHHPHLVYTGSDDCKFSCWDLRVGPSTLSFQNTKSHKMGICCIAKSPTDTNSLLTGSYDERLRVWDTRSISKPVNETSVCLGGGVWRLKHHPNVPGLVLAACMHKGFQVVSMGKNGTEVIETYTQHGSLAYGADWMRETNSAVIASCSFYDRMLRIWALETDISHVL